jgi:beta-N-acetylhexosaminidase
LSASDSARPPRAVIFGCAGPVLTEAERCFFAETDPFGFILFARNIETPEQVRALTTALRACTGRAETPILIDQEGGRVRRLRPPEWREAPAMRPFGTLFARDPDAGRRALALNIGLMADELAGLGIDADCAPVLDVPVAGAHDIIGDRAFAAEAGPVAALGRVVVETFLAHGVFPVIKHIPGHGRAMADSHESLPVVEASRDALEDTDFPPFRALRDAPFAMTAHIVYTALDAARPATLSPVVVGEVIRGALGFDGLLMTDDLSMKALTGPFDARARESLAAGCDLVLHCNGDMAEMRATAAGCRPLDTAASERWERARARKAAAPRRLPDAAAAEVDLRGLLAQGA